MVRAGGLGAGGGHGCSLGAGGGGSAAVAAAGSGACEAGALASSMHCGQEDAVAGDGQPQGVAVGGTVASSTPREVLPPELADGVCITVGLLKKNMDTFVR